MRKLDFLENYYKAFKIQVFYVMLPVLVFFLLWPIIIRVRGEYTHFPYFNQLLLFLLFIAGLRSGYEFGKRALLYYSFGLLFIVLYVSLVTYYLSEWKEFMEEGGSAKQLAFESAKLLAIICAAGFGGCALGKWIHDLSPQRS